MGQGTATKLAPASHATAEASGTSQFLLSARVELYACLQLLAERARFITGASWSAIALREGERFVYRTASGDGAPEIGTEVSKPHGESFQYSSTRQPFRKKLMIPVNRESEMEAFFQIVSNGHEFNDHDSESLARLADLASTAIDHMYAAEGSALVISSEIRNRHRVEAAVSWHAPEGIAPALTNKEPELVSGPASVHLCQSCGFPVSPGRIVCMDCDQRAGSLASPPGLFSQPKSGNWITTHGYTIATLLITAVAAAVIYWLR